MKIKTIASCFQPIGCESKCSASNKGTVINNYGTIEVGCNSKRSTPTTIPVAPEPATKPKRDNFKNGCIAFYKFNTNAKDEYGKYDGKIFKHAGDTGFENAQFKEGVTFSGGSYNSNSYKGIDVSAIPEFSYKAMSISVWIKLKSNNRRQYFNTASSHESSYPLSLANTKNTCLDIYMEGSSQYSGANVIPDDGRYHHLVFSWGKDVNRGVPRVFVDSIEKDLKGCRSKTSEYKFKWGNIYNEVGDLGFNYLRIYDIALNDCEINDLFYEDIDGFQPSDLPTKPTNKFDLLGDGSSVCLYQFNDNCNDTGGVYNTKIEGNVKYTNGRFGRAVMSDNQDKCHHANQDRPNTDVIHLNNDMFNNSDQFTVSFWVSTDGESVSKHGAGDMFSNYTCWDHPHTEMSFDINKDMNIEASFNDDKQRYVRPKAKICKNKFYNLVLAIDKITHRDRFYVNNRLIYDMTMVQNKGNLIAPMTIFSHYKGCSVYDYWNFNGIIDQFRVFNKDLNESEIEKLYKEGM